LSRLAAINPVRFSLNGDDNGESWRSGAHLRKPKRSHLELHKILRASGLCRIGMKQRVGHPQDPDGAAVLSLSAGLQSFNAPGKVKPSWSKADAGI